MLNVNYRCNFSCFHSKNRAVNITILKSQVKISGAKAGNYTFTSQDNNKEQKRTNSCVDVYVFWRLTLIF